ncbi:MAG: hypothetical protein LIO43_04595 [Clostridiales bacterium]|nr:hypothetical protein [Clostridiales bacterium]
MNIVNKLTLRRLRENKGRSVVTTLGIIVSVAMITAVFAAFSSFLNFAGEISLLTNGNQHFTASELSQQQISLLKKDSRIKNISLYSTKQSFVPDGQTAGRGNTGFIFAGDETALKNFINSEYEGTIPENENQIAVEKSYITDNGLNWKIGDTVKICLGTRYYEADGEIQEINTNHYILGENFEKSQTREYKVTAILNDNPGTNGFSVVTRLNGEEMKGALNAGIILSQVNSKSLDEIKDIISEYKIENYNISTDYFQTVFAADDNSIVMSMLPLIAILLAIIIAASVALIYNAFGMSFSENVKYFGMLASVGATKNQKKNSVYFEGLILGAIGIPIGIAAGIAGIAVTLKSIGYKILENGMITGVSETNTVFKTVVPAWALCIIVILSVITIFISAYIPSKKSVKNNSD